MKNRPPLCAPLYPDSPFVQLDYFFYDRQPQARTLDLIRCALPLKQLEYLAAVISLNADPIVFYGKMMEIPGLLITDFNSGEPVASIFDGIIDQISKNPEDGNLVGTHKLNPFRLEQLYTPHSKPGRKLVPQHVKDLSHINRLNLERGFLCGDKQVDCINQGGHMLRCLHYPVTKTGAFLTEDSSEVFLQQSGKPVNSD